MVILNKEYTFFQEKEEFGRVWKSSQYIQKDIKTNLQAGLLQMEEDSKQINKKTQQTFRESAE